MKSPIKVLLAEFFPAFNKGELAILGGMLKSFEAVGKVEVNIFSFNPVIDRKRYPTSVKLVDVGHNLHFQHFIYNESSVLYTYLVYFFAALQHFLFIFLYQILGKKVLKIMDGPLWKTYCDVDVFIIGHDEVDIVNGAGLRFSPLYISLMAKTMKKPVIIYANGTTRFTSEIWIWRLHSRRVWRFLARRLLSIVDLITVREEGTLFYFKEITNGKVPVFLTADPAFLLSPISKKKVEDLMHYEKIEKKTGLLVGLAMSRNVLSGSFKNILKEETKYKKAISEIAKFLDKLIEEYDATLVFLPHSIEPYSYRDDRIVAEHILSSISNKHMTKLITKEYSAEELKGLLGQFDLLISSRCHAAINGLSMGTPTIVLTRPLDERANNIIGKILKQEKWLYSVENLNSDELFALTSDMCDASIEIRRGLLSMLNSTEEKALLSSRLLKDLLNSRFKVTAK